MSLCASKHSHNVIFILMQWNSRCSAFSIILSHLHTDTTRDPHADEDPNSFYFVQEDSMRAEIMQHKFIEFGKHQQHLYGIKSDSVVDVIHSGKMCIMDVHPQVQFTCTCTCLCIALTQSSQLSCLSSSVVEHLPSKQCVAGSSPT